MFYKSPDDWEEPDNHDEGESVEDNHSRNNDL